jgi:hypothetical protein
MAEQDKGNITSNLTASDANKVATTKKPSAKLKSSTVKDAISRTKTMTGSKPDQINVNPIQELNQAFREAVNDMNPDPKHREAVSRSGQDPKQKQLVPRDSKDRKNDDRPYRHQSIVKKIVDEVKKDPWDKIVKAVPKLKGHQERVDALKSELAKTKVDEGTTSSDVAVWDKPPPKGKSTKMTPSQISRAKARAKAAGRPYPNLVDNMAVSIKEIFEDFNQSFKDMLDDAFDTEGFIEEDFEPSGIELYEDWGEPLEEAEKSGRKVKLGKPFLTPGGPKKRAVYVKNENGNVVKVNFGDPNMAIKKHIKSNRKSFRARHNCDNPGPRTKARYWSCKAW